MTEQIKLIHPIYLDVPMLISFAAAVEGGIAYSSEVSKETHTGSSSDARVAGKFGLSSLFNRIFDSSLSIEANIEKSNEEKALKTETRGHTEASIAILLYDKLCKNKSIDQPKEIDELENLTPGTLVELTGKIEKNAVDTVIDYIDAIDILSNLSTTNTKTKGSKKTVAKNNQTPLSNMREILDKDRRRTPISNVLLRCTQPSKCTAVVTLRTAYLRDLTLSELHKNTVRVIGKITRVIKDGESMSAFENYGMALLKSDMLNKAFEELSNNDEIRAEFSDVEINGPAIQVLPLMVFV